MYHEVYDLADGQRIADPFRGFSLAASLRIVLELLCALEEMSRVGTLHEFE
jgi:hypothetical protein